MAEDKTGLLDLLEDQNFSTALSGIADDLPPSIYDSGTEAFLKNVSVAGISGLGVIGLLGTGGIGLGLAGVSALLSFNLSSSTRKRERSLALKEKDRKLQKLVDRYGKAKKDRQKLLDSAGLSQKLANLQATGLGLKQLEARNARGTSGLQRNAMIRKAEAESIADQYIIETERQIKEINDILDVVRTEMTTNRDELDFVLEDRFKREKEDL